EVLKRPHTPIEAVQEAIRSLQAAAGNEGQVMVIEGLHLAAGREGDFFRKSRLELLCELLLTSAYPLRLVFTSLVQPVFYREGRDAPLRRLRVEGIKGRFYYDIFQAMGAPDFPRDRFGPLSEKLHGHALAVRTAAVAIRHAPALVDSDKYFRMEDASDVEEVKKQLEKRIERIPEALRDLLGKLAHLRYPVDASLLSDLGVSRKDRMTLVGEGLLDMVGTEANKRYQVHTLVRSALPARATADFDTFEQLGKRFVAMAAAAEGVNKLALQQEANRCFVEARRFNLLLELDVPDYDGIVESCLGLIRSKTPRYDLAAQRVAELLRRDPGNADAHLIKLELLRRQDQRNEAAQQAVQEALDQAPVPEVHHEAVAFYLARNARNKAIKILEGAVESLPDISRLRTRLASLLLRQGRRPEALEHLKLAMDLDPMLPDAYGLLGMARREEGADKLDEAETLLREAVRLAPHDVVQTSRLVWLLLDIARGVPERATAVREEIRSLLDNLLQHDKKSWEAHLLYAVALREEGADQLERARWFLKQARKLAPGTKGGPSIRFDVEEALLEIAEGKLDEAEARLRRLEKKDPSNHRVFGALARVLESRNQLYAAYAELTRAADRTSPASLDRQAYDVDLQRLRGLIEAEAGVVPAIEPSAGVEAPEDGAPAGDEELAGEAVDGSGTVDGSPDDASEASEEAPEEPGEAAESSDPGWDV
ncbi:MAG TPA: tetratricopeptide repeat protein, partial [Myxococcota bacterium]|nr:tetratricopeptide repeat protein [Myxococcota bacterium]